MKTVTLTDSQLLDLHCVLNDLRLQHAQVKINDDQVWDYSIPHRSERQNELARQIATITTIVCS